VLSIALDHAITRVDYLKPLVLELTLKITDCERYYIHGVPSMTVHGLVKLGTEWAEHDWGAVSLAYKRRNPSILLIGSRVPYFLQFL
jgi:hypothetical protein